MLLQELKGLMAASSTMAAIEETNAGSKLPVDNSK